MPKNAGLKKLQAYLLPADPTDYGDGSRSAYERFALPYVFKPRLSLLQALVATFGALLQILLGSLLFALWGTSCLLVWSALRTHVWRVVVLLPMLVVFLLLLAVLVSAIASLARTVSRKLP